MIEHYGIVIGLRNYISRPSPVGAKLSHMAAVCGHVGVPDVVEQPFDRASISDVVDTRWYSDPTLLGATDVDLA